MLGPADGPVPARVPVDPAVPSAVDDDGSAEAPDALADGLALARAAAEREGDGLGRPTDEPSVLGEAEPGAGTTVTVTVPTSPPPPSRQPGNIATLTRPPRNSTPT